MSIPTLQPRATVGMARPSRMCHTADMSAKQASSAKKQVSSAPKAAAKAAPRKPKAAPTAFELAVKKAVKNRTPAKLPKPRDLSPEEARACLVRLGIVDANGKLTPLYR